MVRWILILMLLSPLALVAQKRRAPKPAPVASTAAWPIQDISIGGNHDYTRDQILGVAGLKLGQMAAAKDFDAARARLEAAGVFEELTLKFASTADKKGYAVSIQLKEAGPLFAVHFENLGVPDAEILKTLAQSDPFFGPHIAATAPVLARYAKVIQDHLGGKFKVVGKLGPDDTGQMVALFRPAGAPPAISRVTFTGNEVIPVSTLANTINPVAVGLPYKEAGFRRLLDSNIRPLYDARGRVRVAFPEIRTERDREVDGLLLTVKVVEGPSYSIGQVAVEGSGLPAAETLKIANLKHGDMFDANQAQAAAERLEKRVRRVGYMRVKSRVDRRVNDPAKAVDLTIHLDNGPRYLFGKLAIQGLDLISEPAIRQLWAVKEGQPFNADYPDYFLARIREDGVLDDLGETKATQKTDDAAKIVDVTLVFRGETKKKETAKQPGEWRP